MGRQHRARIPATIVVPHGNSREKNAAMRAYGARLLEHGRDFDEALGHARALAEAESLDFFPSLHPLLIRGVASYAVELLHAAGELDAIYVPIGLGSGILGVISAREALGSRAEIVGVVSDRADAYARSFESGVPTPTESADTLADGVAVRSPHPDAVRHINAHVSRIVRVSDDEIRQSIRHLFSDAHALAEGAGAAPLAALLTEREAMRGKRVGVVLSGGNIDRELYAEIIGTA